VTTTLPRFAPATTDEWSVAMPLRKFRRTINAMALVVSKDESRPILTGLLFEPTADGGLRVVGTDSYRIAYASLARDLTFDSKPDGERRSIVSGAALRNFLKVVPERSDTGSTVTVTFQQPDRVRVELIIHDGTAFTASLPRIGGEFPQYRHFLEHDSTPVVPDGENDTGFNLAYLNYFYKMALAIGATSPTGDSPNPVRMESHGSLKPAKLWINNRDADILLTCAIMPIRVP